MDFGGPVPSHLLRMASPTFDRPVFVLTADVEWASDFCIDALASFANDRHITPTLFVTHKSHAIAALQAQRRVELGIHLNFMPGSSHGAEPQAVVENLLDIVPRPVATRSHHYLDSSAICRALTNKGLRVDSNLCLLLQPRLEPLLHWSGLLRLPCFWEDDVHWERGLPWDLNRLREAFLTPGLKVLNVHPFMFALNIPNRDFYAHHKPLIPMLDASIARRLRFEGQGTATFLAALVDLVHAQGLGFTTLSQLVADLGLEWVPP